MKQVKVSRQDFLAALRKNRETHRDIFVKALDGWKQRVIAEIEESLAEARAGRQFRTVIHLPQPSDHTSDYDTVIRMAEMSVDQEIELDHREFKQYVLDEWGWKEDFLNTSSMYAGVAPR